MKFSKGSDDASWWQLVPKAPGFGLVGMEQRGATGRKGFGCPGLGVHERPPRAAIASGAAASKR
jgi:hypothetical protein